MLLILVYVSIYFESNKFKHARIHNQFIHWTMSNVYVKMSDYIYCRTSFSICISPIISKSINQSINRASKKTSKQPSKKHAKQWANIENNAMAKIQKDK